MTLNLRTMSIWDIVQLQPNELESVGVFADLGSRVLEIERGAQYDAGIPLLTFLQRFLGSHPRIERSNPKLFRQYQGLVIWLQFICLHLLLDDDLLHLLRDNLITGFKLNADIRGSIKQLFRNSWDPFLRGEKRDLLLRAFSLNNEKIGPYQLELGNNRMVPATVANLIVDYNRFAKSDTERSGLDEVAYLDKSPNTKQLSATDRQLVLKILQVYDFVRFPPLEEMAREMIVSPVRVFSSESAEKRGLPTMPLRTPLVAAGEVRPRPAADPMETLQQRYQLYRTQRRTVLELEDQLMVKTRGDLEAIKRALAAASRSSNRNVIIACMKILARQQQLVASLQESPAWLQAVSEYIVTRYSPRYDRTAVENAVANARLDPTAPIFIAEFLQYLLKEKARMSEGDSALVGIEVGQILGGDYLGIAYGNQETGNFEWAKNKIENQELVSAEGVE